MTVDLSLGHVVKRLRRERCLTQQHLAQRLGVSRPYISYLERGLRRPSLETIFSLCGSLDIGVGEFIDRVTRQL